MQFHNLTCLLKVIILQRFRTASQGLGRFYPAGDELRIRKGSKLFRFICMENELRFMATGQPMVVIPLAPDATVDEFRQSIASLIRSGFKSV
ncbi:MAG: hypothetical protein CFE26_14245 [Verrucomicrobiales bacterium VVV1]|nr:MAG: hypothetical protein CFE26_14245 [Verrucomicrobiales bacterium VVV1]